MKSIVILSGGMDSTTLLCDMVSKGYEIKALSFNYGQKHKKELEYAKKTCTELKIEHKIIDLTNITSLLSNSSLINPDVKVPEGHYAAENMKSTVVPNRNMIMLAIAIGYAENEKYDNVAIANHAGDHTIYPDCRDEFIQALSLAGYLGTFNKIKLYAPYTNITKTDIAEIGVKLGIDYDRLTWSCYKGGEEPCGKCGTCVERNEALSGAPKRI